MTSFVVLEVIIRHEPFPTFLATVPQVSLVHASIVSSQRDFVHRRKTTSLASVLYTTMDLHVTRHLGRTFERLVAYRALVRPQIAVLHHVPLVISLSLEAHHANRTRVLLPVLNFHLPSLSGVSFYRIVITRLLLRFGFLLRYTLTCRTVFFILNYI